VVRPLGPGLGLGQKLTAGEHCTATGISEMGWGGVAVGDEAYGLRGAPSKQKHD
jgi:hypothetical protein